MAVPGEHDSLSFFIPQASKKFITEEILKSIFDNIQVSIPASKETKNN